MEIWLILNRAFLGIAFAAGIYTLREIFSEAKRLAKDKELSAAVVTKLEQSNNSKSFIIEELVQQGFNRHDIERKVDEIFGLMNSLRRNQG